MQGGLNIMKHEQYLGFLAAVRFGSTQAFVWNRMHGSILHQLPCRSLTGFLFLSLLLLLSLSTKGRETGEKRGFVCVGLCVYVFVDPTVNRESFDRELNQIYHNFG